MNWARFGGKSAVWVALMALLCSGAQSSPAQSPAPQPVQKPNTPPERGKLNKQTDDLRQAAEFDAAIPVAERALELERKAGDANQARLADALSRLAELHELRGDWPGAVARRKEALAVRERVDGANHWRTADARLALAFTEKVAGLGPADRGKVEVALRNEQEQARLEVQGKNAEAQRMALEVLQTYRAVVGPETAEVARVWHALGWARLAQNNPRSAKEANEQALAIRRKVLPGNHPRIADSLNNLGLDRHDLRDYAAAKRSHEEALSIRRKALPKDDPAIADSLNNLGAVQCDLKEYAAAKRSHEEALAIRRKALSKDHPQIADSLNNLGKALYRLEAYAPAKADFEEALAIRRRALPKDHPDIAATLNNLGKVWRHLRDYAAARSSHEEALAIFRKARPPGHPDIATCLNDLGNAQDELREYTAARKSYQEALAIRRKALPKDHPDIAHSLLSLGWLALASGVDVGGAVANLAQATDLFQADQLHLAAAQAEQEQRANAYLPRLSMELLIDATITARQDPGPTYDNVVRVEGLVTAQQRWARRARDAADPDTARLLDRLRQVAQQIVGLSMSERPSGHSPELYDVAAELQALSDLRDRLEEQLTERSGAYRSIEARARVGTHEIQAALPRGAALVDLVDYRHLEAPAEGRKGSVFERRMVAFVLRPERKDVVLVSLGPTQILAELIDRWRESYGAGQPAPAGLPDPGAELRKRLWEPLAGHLRDVKVVLVSPDGPLNGLPWAALPGSEPGTFLVGDYAFAVVPVPQLLPDTLRGGPRPPGEQTSLLLAGGIDFGEEIAPGAGVRSAALARVPFFAPLRAAESELNDLRAQFEDAFPDAPAPKRLRKDKATKQAILAAAPTHRFVHLATHGYFAEEPKRPAVEVPQRADRPVGGLHLHTDAAARHPGLLSGLVFAGVNRADRLPEETILTALEAAELNLDKVELVVLSACETGRGRVAGGEGMLGLQRAFQLAGARAVVASLWRVPDEETHQLMREFYRRVWSKDPLSKAEALRQAQLWMLENWKPRDTPDLQAPQGPPPPYVWAAFVLSGDWR
jgi:CHAT domain-containing protein/tetratricopeptide (TPR) repeat protein